jgi:hypothetical protein
MGIIPTTVGKPYFCIAKSKMDDRALARVVDWNDRINAFILVYSSVQLRQFPEQIMARLGRAYGYGYDAGIYRM